MNSDLKNLLIGTIFWIIIGIILYIGNYYGFGIVETMTLCFIGFFGIVILFCLLYATGYIITKDGE